jgi:hypothetical protein
VAAALNASPELAAAPQVTAAEGSRRRARALIPAALAAILIAGAAPATRRSPASTSATCRPETPHLRLSADGCELALFISRPTSAEVQHVHKGIASFAWLAGGPVSVLCFQFGTLPWMDTPYEPWREHALRDSENRPGAERGVPAGEPGQHLLLPVVLVDAGTGIVRALRVVTWEPGFAGQVRDTVRRQLASPRDDAAAGRQLDALYRQDSRALAESAAIRCTGGERLAAAGGLDSPVTWRDPRPIPCAGSAPSSPGGR